jgi:hypothetical protein
MRFLSNKECMNGENHTTEKDGRAVVPVHTHDNTSAQVRQHIADFDILFITGILVQNGYKFWSKLSILEHDVVYKYHHK